MITLSPRHRARLGATAFALGVVVFGCGTTLASVSVNDNTPGLNRTDAPSTSGAQWLVGAPLHINTSSATSALSIKAGAATGSIVGYFTPAGSPDTLAVGEQLSVTFVFSLSNLGTARGVTALRLGLFNSGESRAGDGFGVAGTGKTFTNYTGYAALISTRAVGDSGITIRERVTGTNNLLNATGTNAFSEAVASGSSQAFQAGYNYTVNFIVTRTDESVVDFEVTLSGPNFQNYTLSYRDTTSPTTSFDTLGIGWAPNTLAAEGVITLRESYRRHILTYQ